MKINLGNKIEYFGVDKLIDAVIDMIDPNLDSWVADRVCWTQNAIYWMIEDVIEDYNNNED